MLGQVKDLDVDAVDTGNVQLHGFIRENIYIVSEPVLVKFEGKFLICV